MKAGTIEFLSQHDECQFTSRKPQWSALVAGGCEFIEKDTYVRAYSSVEKTVVRPLREAWVQQYADKLDRTVRALEGLTKIEKIVVFICDVFPWLYLQIAKMPENETLDWLDSLIADSEVAMRLQRQLRAVNWDSDQQTICQVNAQNRQALEHATPTPLIWKSHLELLSGFDPSVDTMQALSVAWNHFGGIEGNDLLKALTKGIYRADLHVIDSAVGHPSNTVLLMLTSQERLHTQGQISLLHSVRQELAGARVPIIIGVDDSKPPVRPNQSIVQ